MGSGAAGWRQNADRLKCCILGVAMMAASNAAAQVEYVDPTIGNVGILLEPTRPTVYLPNSMVRIYPMRAGCAGRSDRVLSPDHQFSSHAGVVQHHARARRRPQPTIRKRPRLITTPTRFDDSLIRAEFSPTERCGYFRFTFPDGNASRRAGQPHAPATCMRRTEAQSAAKNDSAT